LCKRLESARELFIIWKFRVEIGEALRVCLEEAARDFGRVPRQNGGERHPGNLQGFDIGSQERLQQRAGLACVRDNLKRGTRTISHLKQNGINPTRLRHADNPRDRAAGIGIGGEG